VFDASTATRAIADCSRLTRASVACTTLVWFGENSFESLASRINTGCALPGKKAFTSPATAHVKSVVPAASWIALGTEGGKGALDHKVWPWPSAIKICPRPPLVSGKVKDSVVPLFRVAVCSNESPATFKAFALRSCATFKLPATCTVLEVLPISTLLVLALTPTFKSAFSRTASIANVRKTSHSKKLDIKIVCVCFFFNFIFNFNFEI